MGATAGLMLGERVTQNPRIAAGVFICIVPMAIARRELSL
ncbi:hypothetical protein FHY31_003768 [Xanthomonas euvesicatoria]|nr:hypothetical protein [Xanthomonas euvesicatoria]